MTPELRRIIALPRRALSGGAGLAAFWTRVLRRTGGTQTLNEEQAYGLEDAYRTGGRLYFSGSVGSGKTLLGYLLCTLFEAERACVVAPSGMHDEMRAMHAAYARHWLSPPAPIRLVAYEDLDRRLDNLWLELRADAMIFDEAHRARRADRLAVKQTERYLRLAAKGLVPAPRVRACLTATPGRKSILDNAHQLVWVLEGAAPVPQGKYERSIWAGALDLDSRHHYGVGVLRDLGGEGKTLRDRARDWYRQRLADTAGVVMLSTDSCQTALALTQICPPPDAKIEAAFERFRTRFEAPGGDTVSDPLEGFRLESELSLGYYGVWDPEPPVHWLVARKRLRAFVRKRVKDSQRGGKPLDTEARVIAAHREHPIVAQWLAVRDDYRIAPKPRWLSASVVQYVAEWLRDNGPAMAYVWSVPFATALAKASGLPWYGRLGKDALGRYLGDAQPDRSVIVSGQANTEGRNLQRWNRAIYVNPPPSAQWLEQAFGRMSRQGQTRDVEIFFLISSGGVRDAFEAACDEAEFGKSIWQVDQKIRRATIARVTLPAGTYRWA